MCQDRRVSFGQTKSGAMAAFAMAYCDTALRFTHTRADAQESSGWPPVTRDADSKRLIQLQSPSIEQLESREYPGQRHASKLVQHDTSKRSTRNDGAEFAMLRQQNVRGRPPSNTSSQTGHEARSPHPSHKKPMLLSIDFQSQGSSSARSLAGCPKRPGSPAQHCDRISVFATMRTPMSVAQ